MSLTLLALAMSPLINGYFDHVPDDADASITVAGGIGVTWRAQDLGTGGAATISRQAFTFGQTDVAEDPEYFLRWAQTTGGTVTNPELLNLVEDVRTLAGELVTIQGYYRSNTTVDVQLRQDFGSGGSPSADVNVTAITLPNTVDVNSTAQWKPFSVTFRLPRITGKTLGSTANTSYVGVRFKFPLATAFQFDIANVRMTKGGSRDVSPRRPKQLELALTRRFYGAYAVVGNGADDWTGFTTQMRAVPTVAGSVGTVDQATVDGCKVNHTSDVAVALTADARLSA